MEIRSCQVFLQLAQSMHFGRTAAICNLSPSAVSRLVQRLEDEIGQILVERDNRHVSLTPAGRHFLDYARKTVDDWQQVRADLNASRARLSGEISVFGSVTASYSMLTQILPGMRESYPGIEIKLRTGDQADGVERVMDGGEDCAIIALPDTVSDKLEFLPLRTTPLLLIGPKMPSALSRQLDQYLAEQSEPVWSEIPMILAERGLARKRLLQRFKDINQQPKLYAQVAGHEAVVSMVSLGFGVALVPELVIQHSPKQETVRVLPWFSGLPPFALGLCALKDRLKDPLLQALWRCAVQTHPQ
jgi:LysR family positive regulator for ilvC